MSPVCPINKSKNQSHKNRNPETKKINSDPKILIPTSWELFQAIETKKTHFRRVVTENECLAHRAQTKTRKMAFYGKTEKSV